MPRSAPSKPNNAEPRSKHGGLADPCRIGRPVFSFSCGADGKSSTASTEFSTIGRFPPLHSGIVEKQTSRRRNGSHNGADCQKRANKNFPQNRSFQQLKTFSSPSFPQTTWENPQGKGGQKASSHAGFREYAIAVFTVFHSRCMNRGKRR